MNQEPNELGGRTGTRLAFGVRPEEATRVLWCSAHFFFLLAAYYVIHAIRDAMGLTGGLVDLQRLFLATLLITLVANPLFGALVSRFSRRVFVPVVYLFFAANLLVFFLLFRQRAGSHDIHLARAFFVWVSVFNLFIVSVFWALMADIFDLEQGRRLFGLIGVGGTLGALVGAAGTAALADKVGEVQLIPASAVLLVAACICALRTMPLSKPTGEQATVEDARGMGGRAFAGFTHVWYSPYLRGICLLIFLTTFSASLSYFAQGTIIEQFVASRDRRAALFASIDLVVNSATVLFQILLTGRIIRLLGVGWALAILPIVFFAGFCCLALAPVLSVLFVVQVVQRALIFGLTRPAQESLFIVVPREDKYKAKNFVDTFVYSGGDAAGAAAFALMTNALGLDLSRVLLLSLPAMVAWLVVALYLGRQQQQNERRQPCSV